VSVAPSACFGYRINTVDTFKYGDMENELLFDDALQRMHFAFRAITAEPDRILAKRGLGRAHHRILYVIARHPEIALLRLIDALGISRQALHRPVAQLVAQQLVIQQPDITNRRVSRLRLTTQGAALERKISGLQRKYFAGAFTKAGPQATRHWYAIMKLLGEVDGISALESSDDESVATLQFR
jgi:DNA-binding MarR family transcriptional regulator